MGERIREVGRRLIPLLVEEEVGERSWKWWERSIEVAGRTENREINIHQETAQGGWEGIRKDAAGAEAQCVECVWDGKCIE